MFFTNYSKALIVIVLMLSASLLAGDDNEPRWGKVTDAEWQIGPPPEYPEANAVIIFDRGKLSVSFEHIELSRHVRMKILTKAGINEVGDLSFGYFEGDKIKEFEAHTITPDGRMIKVEKKSILTKSIGGLKFRTLAFSAVDSGCILEYKYIDVNNRYFDLDPWFFQSTLFTMESVFELHLVAGFTYSTAPLNMPAGRSQPVVAEGNENFGGSFKVRSISYTYTLNNMPPIREEPYMGVPTNYMAAIYSQLVSAPGFTFMKDWSDLGKGFQGGLIDEYIKGVEDIYALTDSLTATCTNQEEKVKAIYDFISREIKTMDETGGFFLHDHISEILIDKNGAISDKNLLMTEMLKHSGLEAWPVLIGSRHKHIFMPKLFHLRQFDYLITACKIDGGFMFLDAQSENIPYGVMPLSSRVEGGVIIDSEKSYLAKVVYKDPETQRLDHTVIRLDSMGSAACSTHIEFSGYLASEYRRSLAEENEEDLVKENFLDPLNLPYQLQALTSQPHDLDKLSLNMIFSLEGLVSHLDDNYVIKPIRFFFRENPFTNKKRFSPIDFEYPRVYRNHCEITLAEGMVVLSLPEPVTVDIDGISFTTQYLNSGQSLYMLSTLQFSKSIFPHYRHEELKIFFDQVAASMEDRVILSVAAR